MSDPWENAYTEPHHPKRNQAAVAPDDNNDLPNSGTLFVGVKGDIEVMLDGADTPDAVVVYKNVEGVFPYVVKRVLAANTTATDIVVNW